MNARSKITRNAEVPSKEKTQDWFYAESPDARHQEPDGTGGKWLMFVAGQFVDDTWKNVSAAVREGRLAEYAKISTKVSTPSGRPYVLCVYVLDYKTSDDKPLALAVRERLRNLKPIGFKRKIPFKLNSVTIEGESASEFIA